MSQGRFQKGTFVRAVINETNPGNTYTREAVEQRVIYNEMVGEVVGHSDSHGLCYEVRFVSGRNHDIVGTAWFEPDELEEST